MAGEKLVGFIKNQVKSGPQVELGTIVSDPPHLSIKLDQMKVPLSGDFLVYDGRLLEDVKTETCVGSRVAVMAIESGRRYYVIGKVVEA